MWMCIITRIGIEYVWKWVWILLTTPSLRPEMDIGPCEVITQPCFTTQQRYENMVSLSFLFLHDSTERPKRVFVKVCVLPLIHGNRGKCMALYIWVKHEWVKLCYLMSMRNETKKSLWPRLCNSNVSSFLPSPC